MSVVAGGIQTKGGSVILILSKEEQELVQRLRAIGKADTDSVPALSQEVLTLKRQIAQLEIDKAKKEEDFARQDRELRHMIGLEKKEDYLLDSSY